MVLQEKLIILLGFGLISVTVWLLRYYIKYSSLVNIYNN